MEIIIILFVIVCSIILVTIKNNSKSANREPFDKEEYQKKLRQKNIDKLEELKTIFSAPITTTINYSNSKYILISEDKSLIMINEQTYSFDDIIDFSIFDNTTEIFSSSSKTTTDSASMIGRTIVGGMLSGSTGALIGGITANKTTETSGVSKKTKHNYTINIIVNNISNPIETICFKENDKDANTLCSILTIILHRKK